MGARPRSLGAFASVLIGVLALGSGCADDAVGVTGDGSGDSTGTTMDSGPSITTSGLGSSGTESNSASGGADSTGTDGTGTDSGSDSGTEDTGTGSTGGDPVQGQTAHGFVNAGTVSQSPGYRLIWTFGQETQNQNTMNSPGYTMHGGIIGAGQ